MFGCWNDAGVPDLNNVERNSVAIEFVEENSVAIAGHHLRLQF